jgi:subtilisin family serine protease
LPDDPVIYPLAAPARSLPSPRLRWLAALFTLLAFLAVPVGDALPTARPAAALECDSSTLSSTTAAHRSQHLTRLGVDRWHAAGLRGRGVKVAILDSGFRGYREFLGKSLPARVTVRSFRFDGNLEARDSQHGILCGEVVHALAPDAELLFANWESDRPEQFLAAVRWAVAEGARVISCSVIMPSWSDGEGGGRVHAQLARLLGPGNEPVGRLCFASAGNTAERHWSGTFHDDGSGFHEWADGKNENVLTPWGTERVTVELCTKTAAAYEVTILDRTDGVQVARAQVSEPNGHACAIAQLYPRGGHSYYVRVRLLRGPAGPFHVVALGAGLEYATARGSIPFPGDGPAVVAVGAVDENGQRQSYSSCGPNSARLKPDFVAPVPFPSQCRTRPFGGTSAAAPQAAGLAVLWWARHPEWTANQVQTALRDSAQDIGIPGPDYETGYGLLRLPWSRLSALEKQVSGRSLAGQSAKR